VGAFCKSIHEAGGHAFEGDASFFPPSDQVAYRAVVGETHEIAEVAILELRKALAFEAGLHRPFDQQRHLMGSLGARGSWLVLVRKDAAGAVSDSEDGGVLGSLKRVAHHQSFDAIRFESAEIPEEVGCLDASGQDD